MAKLNKLIIGIDPGVKTGYAVWNKSQKKFELVKTYKIHEAMKEIELMYDNINNHLFYTITRIVVEDARLWTYHKKTSSAKLQGAGSIKRDCKIWEDFLNDIFKNSGVEIIFKKPNNHITKLTKEQFYKLTGFSGKTSEHARDAAMLVYGL